MVASKFWQDKVAHMLVQYQANVNYLDSFGNTALYKAAYWGHSSGVKLLLEAGADKSIGGSSGNPLVCSMNSKVNKHKMQVQALLA